MRVCNVSIFNSDRINNIPVSFDHASMYAACLKCRNADELLVKVFCIFAYHRLIRIVRHDNRDAIIDPFTEDEKATKQNNHKRSRVSAGYVNVCYAQSTNIDERLCRVSTPPVGRFSIIFQVAFSGL